MCSRERERDRQRERRGYKGGREMQANRHGTRHVDTQIEKQKDVVSWWVKDMVKI